MIDSRRTKAQLIEELTAARQHMTALEAEQQQTREQLRLCAAAAFYQGWLVRSLREEAEQIQTRLHEREVLLQEIHHRVKNNLQIVSSLLYIQSEYIQDQQAQDALIDSQNRIRSMALIHETLYRTEAWTIIDFAEYVHNLSAYLFQAYGVSSSVVTLEISFANIFLPVDTALPCGLIIAELISNALKHAFPPGLGRAGQIRIGLETAAERQFELTIADNGVGLPEDIELQSAETLGLQLVRMLTRQLGGTVEIDRRQGTRFRLVFAL